ncbi:MAG: site-2 protease family protein [Planctomycetes bacterium]|nr:site-2 protease family protein [Planctomycetota bacterium]
MNWLGVGGIGDATGIVLWLLAWFVTIGLHEGAHAWTAWWLGDDTAHMLGKRSINPVRHIDFKDQRSILFTVVMPLISTIAGFLPIGIAWVPVNPSKFRHPTRDMAITAIAGPGGNLIAAILGAGLFVLASFLYYKLGQPGTPISDYVALSLLFEFGWRMVLLNILLGAINLVPLPGVDGGTVLYHFMNYRGRELFDRLAPYGLMIFLVIMFTVGRPFTQKLVELSMKLLGLLAGLGRSA